MLEKRGNAAHEKTGKACNVDPKDAVLHSIKQDLKAEEVGDSINSELESSLLTSLFTKRVVDH